MSTSIIIPTYNRKNLVCETIQSALNQTRKVDEIIVVDNFSLDGTKEYLEEKFKDYENIRIYQNDEKLSIVNNWSKAISYSETEYSLLLWSDDIIECDFIEKCSKILKENSKTGFVFTKTSIFGDKIKKRTVFDLKSPSSLLKKEVFLESSYLYNQLRAPVSPANTLFRTKDLKNSLLSNFENPLGIDFSNIGQGNDLLIFLLTLSKYDYFYYLNEVKANFRAHKQSITLSSGRYSVALNYSLARLYALRNFKDEKSFPKLVISLYSFFMFLYWVSIFSPKIKRLTHPKKIFSFYQIDSTQLRFSLLYLIRRILIS